MSRGTFKPQDDSSSEWQLNTLKELRRLLQETEFWPDSGDQLISDLLQPTNLNQKTSPDEDDAMLSIVVSDALIGVDIKKKYPAFYSRMLVDEELQSAFLDTLELLEQSRSGELPDYTGSDTINLEFLQKLISKPAITKSLKDKLLLVWERTAEQLQNMFYLASLQPGEVTRSTNFLLDESNINILHSLVEVGEQELDIRLDGLQTITQPDDLDLILAISPPEDLTCHFEVTLAWGDYQGSAVVNKYGLAKLPPLKTSQVFAPSGELTHGLELRLEQVD